MPGPPAGQHPRFYTNMPAGAATPQRLGTIDPSSLIGRPENIVEPRNVALLSDAFRQGFITADDVISRVGELGKTKEKAELMQAQEAISPEQQALRAQQVAAGTEQAALAEAQAEKAQVYQKFPGVKDYDELRSLAAILEEPKTPEGKPDYAQMAVIGSKLKLQKAEKDKALLDRNNIEAHYDENARIVSSFTKQGLPVSPEYVQNLDRVIASPFSAQMPGTAQTMVSPRGAAPGIGMNGMPLSPEESQTAGPEALVAPRAASAPTTGESPDQLRARMAEKFGLENIIQLSEDELRRLDAPAPMVTPRAAPAAVAPAPVIGAAPVGARVGMGFSLGALPAPRGKPVDAVERAQQIAKAEEQTAVIEGAAAAVTRGVGIGPTQGNPITQAGNYLASALQLGREQEFKDQRTLEMAISTKILEGAQVMKGNLSDKDVRFLQGTVPKLSDPPAVWKTYLNRWDQMNRLNLSILRGEIEKPSGDVFAPADWVDPENSVARDASGNLFGSASATTSPAAKSGATPIITLSSGKRVQRDAQGNFQPVP